MKAKLEELEVVKQELEVQVFSLQEEKRSILASLEDKESSIVVLEDEYRYLFLTLINIKKLCLKNLTIISSLLED